MSTLQTVDHYENFPVASFLLPARLRPAVAVIYHFARSADDFADEGDVPNDERLTNLAIYHAELQRIEQNLPPASPQYAALFTALAKVVHQWQLPTSLFHDLLSAFEQDVVIKRYADLPSLLDYCSRSANPVGRLMLHLYGALDETALQQSDAICTGLQLINFWQDVAIDWQKARIYFPQSAMQEHGVTENMLANGKVTPEFAKLMQSELKRAQAMLESGTPLAKRLPGRIGWELRLVIAGGLRIIGKIEAVDYDVFSRRPTLQKHDWLKLVWQALLF